MKIDNEKNKIFLALVLILWAGLTGAIWCSSEWQTLIKLAVTALTSLAACGLSISLVLKVSVENNKQTQSANGGQNFIINKPAIYGPFNVGGNPHVSDTSYDEVAAVKTKVDPNSIQR